MVILYLEVHERLIVGLFDLKKTQDKKMNFFTKTMDLPLSKNKSFATFEIRYF